MRMAELRRLVSQNSSVEEIQAIGDGLAKDFKAHQEDLAKYGQDVGNGSQVMTSGWCLRSS